MSSFPRKRSKAPDIAALIALGLSIFYYPLYLMSEAYEYLYYILVAAFFAFCVFYFRPSKSISFVGIIVFSIYMSFISVVGIFFSENLQHLSQVVIYLAIPAAFFISGYSVSAKNLLRNLVVLLTVVFAFTVIERAEFWLDLDFLGFVEFSARMKSAAFSYGSDPTYGRASGLFINPNQLGFFAGSILFSILSIKSTKEIKGLVFICIMSVVLILASGSRGSMLAFIIATLVYVVTSRSFRLLPAVIGATAVIFVGYAYLVGNASGSFEGFMDRLLYNSTSQSDSLTGRLTFWSSVFNNVNLLTGTLIPPEMYLGHAIDSFYMRMLAQGGVLGLVSGIFLLVAQFIGSRRLAPTKAKAAFWALLAFVVVNSFSMLGLLDLEAVFVWMILGLVAKRTQAGLSGRSAGQAVAI